jgi:hypothetical protein
MKPYWRPIGDVVQMGYCQAYCFDNVFKELFECNGNYTVAKDKARGEAGAAGRRDEIRDFKDQEVACDKRFMNEYINCFEPRYQTKSKELSKVSKKDQKAQKKA